VIPLGPVYLKVGKVFAGQHWPCSPASPGRVFPPAEHGQPIGGGLSACARARPGCATSDAAAWLPMDSGAWSCASSSGARSAVGSTPACGDRGAAGAAATACRSVAVPYGSATSRTRRSNSARILDGAREAALAAALPDCRIGFARALPVSHRRGRPDWPGARHSLECKDHWVARGKEPRCCRLPAHGSGAARTRRLRQTRRAPPSQARIRGPRLVSAQSRRYH